MSEENSTQRFLRLMNEANAKIADNVEEKQRLGEDPVRQQRQAERRERLGQLRARPHARSKTRQVKNVFGHSRIDGSETS